MSLLRRTPTSRTPRAGRSVRALGAALGLAVAASVTAVAAPAHAATSSNPLARALYSDTQDWTTTQAVKAGSVSAAQIGQVPMTHWVGPADQPAWIADYLSRAQASGRTPSLVLYAIPGRDCGSYSAGGFTTSTQYISWVRMIRRAIAARPTVVVVEPDALAQGSCSGTATDTAARVALIGQAVDILTRDATTAVYVDAGHEWWMDAATAASRLVGAHVQKARGFSLNVSNFYTTSSEVAFGQKVVGLIKGLAPSADPHFVVDTSRNGNGPAPTGPLDWCNPTGRQLGTMPGAVAGVTGLDGYLWVKHPGESDGACHAGDPTSGQWYGAWADDIVNRTMAAQGVL